MNREVVEQKMDMAVHNYEAINWYIVHSIVKKHLADCTAVARLVSLKLNHS